MDFNVIFSLAGIVEMPMLAKIKRNFLLHCVVAKNISRNPKFWLVFFTDMILLTCALYISYSLRFEGADLRVDWLSQFFTILPVILLVKAPVFYFFGLYRGMWRYTSTDDLVRIIKATFTAVVLGVVVLLYINRFEGLSRSVFILDTVFTFLFISGHRVSIRFLYDEGNGSHRFFSLPSVHKTKRLLLIGVGDSAEKILRELNSNRNLPYLPVGLVDIDPGKIGMKIHGVPVVGIVGDLQDHIERVSAEELLIAAASVPVNKMKHIVEICQTTKIPFKVIPAFGELLDGKVSLKSIRDISYKDLLGRAEVVLEQEKVGGYLANKIVLITGAGGSIGSELCRQILRFSPKQLILFDSSEENLYAIQMELIHECKLKNVIPVLGKVQDIKLLKLIFAQYKPAVVFHAAAYKHVPLIEENPWQAVQNNIFATQLLMEASILYQVERFVLVSTDKAVRPTNVMGASKRFTELLMQAYDWNNWDGCLYGEWEKVFAGAEVPVLLENKIQRHSTRIMAVRFGNVIGSSGSVMPLFKRQIENGGPVTVTHPEVTRYFMLVEEASQLILQAGSMGEGGEIFILKMGEPIKISNMARDLIKLAGKEPDTEIEIQYTQLRAGEKLYEELITVGEGIIDTNHEKILVLRGNHYVRCSHLFGYLEKFADDSGNYCGQTIKKTLHHVIPEYTPDVV